MTEVWPWAFTEETGLPPKVANACLISAMCAGTFSDFASMMICVSASEGAASDFSADRSKASESASMEGGGFGLAQLANPAMPAKATKEARAAEAGVKGGKPAERIETDTEMQNAVASNPALL